jgi:hypothetical protein
MSNGKYSQVGTVKIGGIVTQSKNLLSKFFRQIFEAEPVVKQTEHLITLGTAPIL